MAIGKRAVVRTGFLVLIALLIISTFVAYRIQDLFSRRTAQIHHEYVQQQQVLNNLRRTLWLSGITARDFFLNSGPDRVEKYHFELAGLQKESVRQFDLLRSSTSTSQQVRELQDRFRDLWATLTSSAASALDDAMAYSFVQTEIVPRRDAAAEVLRQLERQNEAALALSEEEFSKTRRAAAQGLLGLLGIGLLIGVAVTSFSLRYSENLEREAARRFEEISAAKQELESLSARLMEIQEEERTRLSRELHDEIVQTLAVLKIEITQAQAMAMRNNPEFMDNLARARDLAERTVKTVRNITLLLRPSLLDDLGLGPALQWQAEDFTRRTKVPCEYYEQGLAEDLPEAVKTCVYRVTQEALHNCEKHADAAHVRVVVSQSANSLTVCVEDDGVGFTGKRNSGGPGTQLGLLGMRERAAGLSGTLTMSSTPGRGTKITLQVPVEVRRASEAHA